VALSNGTRMADTGEVLETLPLDALHRDLGARMVPFAGYAMPIQYEGIIAEHQWTRTSAGLFDVSHMGQVFLTGDGVDVALEALVPGDLTGLAEGALRYSMLLNADGGILDDLMITRRAADFYLVVNGAVKHADIAHMQAHLPPSVTLAYRPDLALLALQGPQTVAVLEALAPGVGALSFMRAAAFTVAGLDCWVSRSGYTGEDGYEISVAAADAEELARALLADARVKPIGLGARDSLRLEAGLPLYGHDMDTTRTPVEAGLAFAVSKRRRVEGGFPGATTILAQLADGPAEKRVGIAVEGRLPAREGAEIYAGDARVGVVTSGGFAPTVGAPIAMGYVAAAHAATGTALEIDVRGRRLAARVVPMPFTTKNYVR
jgi:aminomethyltransferase